jgi:hypothetical protein
LRGTEIALPRNGTGAWVKSVLEFLDAQRPPFLPLLENIDGNSVLYVEYAAPSPLGLLSEP